MTWGEFKKAVEAQGINDESIIEFIDWDDAFDVEVEPTFGAENTWSIT